MSRSSKVEGSSYTYDSSASRTAWQIAVSPTDGATVQKTINGLLTSTSRHPLPPPAGIVNSQLSIVNYAYDPLGRQVCTFTPSPEGRLTATLTQHNAKGQVAWTQDASGARTTYAHDPLGRIASATDPLGEVTHYSYDSEGRTTGMWGATYPVAYRYDQWGRMVAMATTRDPSPSALDEIIAFATPHSSLPPPNSLDVTQWFYDNPTGLLTNKTYADGNGPSYAYTPDGKLATRTWARGTATTYAYDDAGNLTSVDYSDNTPSISYTHNRHGRMLSAITGGIATNHFSYSIHGLLTNEVVSPLLKGGGGNAAGGLSRAYDPLGRLASITSQLLTPNSSLLTSNAYSYDPLGRIASVASATNNSSLLTSNSYTYDSLGRLLTRQTATGNWKLETPTIPSATSSPSPTDS